MNSSMSVDKQENVLCVGLICLDIINYLDHYPEEDSDQACDQIWTLGGNAINNVKVLSRLMEAAGKKWFPSFMGVLAKDHTLGVVNLELEKLKLLNRCHIITRPDARLSISSAVVNRSSGTRTITHCRGKLEELRFNEFTELITKYSLTDVGWIHFEGRNLTQVPNMIKWIVEQRRKQSLEFKVSLELEKGYPNMECLLIPGLDLIIMGKTFAKSRGFKNMEDAVTGLAKICSETEAKSAAKGSLPANCSADPLPDTAIICAWDTQGACGVRVSSPDHVIRSPSFPPPNGSVVDTLGAGDTFLAGVIYSMVLNRSNDPERRLQTALSFGCRLAGLKVGSLGFNFDLDQINFRL